MFAVRSLLLVSAATTFAVSGQNPKSTFSFTVSMPAPAAHRFHVSMRCEGLHGKVQDFKLPEWSPGYYRLMHYADRVTAFQAHDNAGRPLEFEKVARNTWRVVTSNAHVVTVEYDVTGFRAFPAENYLDEKRAFISAPGLYMHVAGELSRPVRVTFDAPKSWSRIFTGLDHTSGSTYRAPDFDTLYDCPTLLGNQETFSFTVDGKPHDVALEDVPPELDRKKIAADLEKIVRASAGIIGDLPYSHYTFLLMGNARGGIEHINSQASFFDGKGLSDPTKYQGWLSFVAHEYFHHYNVKRIRPIALGPFDYDRENLSSMLWVSEGLTVYYEDVALVRAGLMTRDEYLKKLEGAINRFENSPGRRYQSAADASRDAWGNSGVGVDRNTSISYYENGAMLGAVLDLAIRKASRGKRSLDDAMRGLYRQIYLGQHRGFTDAEFRLACEAAAGTTLDEVFEYASTTREIDYGKHLAYAGLAVDTSEQPADGLRLGARTETRERGLLVRVVESDSPAERAGVRAGDLILEAGGLHATPKAVNDLLMKTGTDPALMLKVERDGKVTEVRTTLIKNTRRTYRIAPAASAGDLEKQILASWLPES